MNKSPFQRRTYALCAGVVGCALSIYALVGCGSSNQKNIPTTVVENGKFYGPAPAQFTGPNGTVTLGRSYVTLNNGVPTAVGFELSEAGREGQPATAITDEAPNIYFVALPAEASMTCFKQLGVFYFTGHPVDQYRPFGEPAHFHTVFLINAPNQPGTDFSKETVYPSADEVAPGVSRGVPDTVVPGVGVSYDNPVKPAGQPARITIGHNYLYYLGHMNGMVVGTNLDKAFDSTAGHYLRDPKQLETDIITQPKIYPRPGWYPGRWTIKNDRARHVNIFELSDFVYAGPNISRKVDTQ